MINKLECEIESINRVNQKLVDDNQNLTIKLEVLEQESNKKMFIEELRIESDRIEVDQDSDYEPKEDITNLNQPLDEQFNHRNSSHSTIDIIEVEQVPNDEKKNDLQIQDQQLNEQVCNGPSINSELSFREADDITLTEDKVCTKTESSSSLEISNVEEKVVIKAGIKYQKNLEMYEESKVNMNPHQYILKDKIH
ncbi:hypothetical protein [Bacillus sp. S/N-304-OC-R1]|uniref:hypothetical protein n=1 Tax=Bacillus sp. S/N-304-OC-R1 TaxID=2758034 RepID=UPI001C8D35A0|nr:hypothetical protein [Bacillus sp. S/N-304-OC-R1]MBY0124390.1 hypothetical protein [Bacillus sp. S/N-304-OC-R1]